MVGQCLVSNVSEEEYEVGQCLVSNVSEED